VTLPQVAADTVIATTNLCLRRPSRDDVGSIAALASEWEVAKQTGRIPHPYNAIDAEQWLTSVMGDDGEEMAFVITLVEPHSVVGAIGLAPAHIGEGIELGFWIGKPYWGRGYATEAVSALLRHAFDDLGLTHIVAGAFRENRASRRVLEKVGFEKTSVAEMNWPHRGGHRDIQRYAITRELVQAA
jgi:ribosomal-protein-alanine N-acetyltransferase